MLLYAAMSGVSITLVVPVLDVVFKQRTGLITIHTLGGLSQALLHRIGLIFQSGVSVSQAETLKHSNILTDIREILMNTEPNTVLWGISILVVSLFIIKNALFIFNRYLFTNLRGRSVRDIRNLIFGKYMSQSLSFFNQNRVGDSLVRLDNDVSVVSNEFISNLFVCLREIFVMLSCLTVAFYMNQRLFFISLLVTPIFALSISYIGKKIKKYAKRIQAQYSSMFSQTEEALNSMRIVKAYAREDFELSKYAVINNVYRKLWQKVEMYQGYNIPISEISTALIGVVLLLVAGKEVLSQTSHFTLGAFTAFLIAIFATLHPLKTLTKAYADIKKALVSLDRISYIINLPIDITEKPDAVEKKSFEQDVRLEDVGFAYKKHKKVLQHISFAINKGETLAIIGSSGAGKTTLVNLLNRMYDYTEGRITIDGTDIKDIKLKDLRALFGFVPQDSILFSNTVAYNINYGSQRDLSAEEIKHAAQIAYADEFIEKYPDAYNYMLQTKALDLSGGQRQRLCIARAIAANPPILIFDEATSSLDTDSERKVQAAIERATENRTVIIIAHRLSTVLSADRIVVMEQGNIVGIGSHDELLKSCPRYVELYKLQFNPDEHIRENL